MLGACSMNPRPEDEPFRSGGVSSAAGGAGVDAPTESEPSPGNNQNNSPNGEEDGASVANPEDPTNPPSDMSSGDPGSETPDFDAGITLETGADAGVNVAEVMAGDGGAD